MSLKEDIEAILHPERKSLVPPRAPAKDEQEVCEGSSPEGIARSVGAPHEISSSKSLAIDFSYLTNNSSFQRAIIEFIKKFIPGFENIDPRGSKEVVIQNLNQNITNYRDVMKELKEVLKKRNERRN